MERLTYRITLDAYKNGMQRVLQGFHVGEKYARRIEISLAAGSDTYEIPKENCIAAMYIVRPGVEETSINACEIVDNRIIYDLVTEDVATEGLLEMQAKLIMTDDAGDPKMVLLSAKFGLEVLASDADDEGGEATSTFTALEAALAEARSAYQSSVESVTVDEDYNLIITMRDGNSYTSTALAEAITIAQQAAEDAHSAASNLASGIAEAQGYATLSKSWATGETGARDGEGTNNSRYYAGIASSSAAGADRSRDEAASILDEMRQHTNYTDFDVNFETGNLEYGSQEYTFDVNEETGDLEYSGTQTGTFTFVETYGLHSFPQLRASYNNLTAAWDAGCVVCLQYGDESAKSLYILSDLQSSGSGLTLMYTALFTKTGTTEQIEFYSMNASSDMFKR